MARSPDACWDNCDRSSASDCLEARKNEMDDLIHQIDWPKILINTCRSALSRLISASSLRTCSLGIAGLPASLDELL